MRRRDVCLGLVAMPALIRSAMGQEVSRVALVKQHGLPYLPLMVMEQFKLVEKHAARLGVPSLAVQYTTLGGTASLVEALLSGQMNFGVTGVPGLATLWDKTAGTIREVRALAAVQAMPFMLIANNPAVNSIRDLTAKDKIAVPAVKVSAQAVCLQMAATKEWGPDQYARLDPLTITLPHPDATVAIVSKLLEVTAHYAVAPYYQYELTVPGIRQILKSYDTFGGQVTNGVMIMLKSFGDSNRKTSEAVFAALDEANNRIRMDPKAAAQVYMTATNEKRNNLDEVALMVSDPDNVWTTTPINSMKYLEFMHRVGTVKNLPISWKEMYMPQTQALAGS